MFFLRSIDYDRILLISWSEGCEMLGMCVAKKLGPVKVKHLQTSGVHSSFNINTITITNTNIDIDKKPTESSTTCLALNWSKLCFCRKQMKAKEAPHQLMHHFSCHCQMTQVWQKLQFWSLIESWGVCCDSSWTEFGTNANSCTGLPFYWQC